MKQGSQKQQLQLNMLLLLPALLRQQTLLFLPHTRLAMSRWKQLLGQLPLHRGMTAGRCRQLLGLRQLVPRRGPQGKGWIQPQSHQMLALVHTLKSPR